MRARGTGSFFYRDRGELWCFAIELPPVAGKRRKKVYTSKSREVLERRIALINSPQPVYKSRAEQMKIARALGEHESSAWRAKLQATRKCPYCKTPLNRFNWSQDHTIPVAHGGSDAIDNLQATCWECNRDKRDSLDYSWDGPPRKFACHPRRLGEYKAYRMEHRFARTW